MKNVTTKLLASTAILVGTMPFVETASAACTTSGITTTCDSTSPNPSTSQIGTGASTASGYSVIVQNGAQIDAGTTQNAITLGDNATINLQSGASVTNSPTTNSSNVGAYNTGYDTIEFRNNGTLTVAANAQVTQTGISTTSEAVNVEGYGNTITNYGYIYSKGSAAIWFQDQATKAGTMNTVDNYGTIETGRNGGNFSVIGNSGNGAVSFINRSGAIVKGDITFAGGDDRMTLYTGSTITGSINGGGGTNTMVLAGTGSDALSGAINNFSFLTKADSGTWTLTGDIANTGSNASTQIAVDVQAGTLVLTGNNAKFQGSVTVDNGGTLQLGKGGTTGDINSNITDNGTVAFNRSDSATFDSLISGSGNVQQNGSGTIALTGVNTYTGGTFLNNGTLAVGADSALGDASGGVTFNGGTLQLPQRFDLASTRAVTINAAGGTIDTQGFDTTVTQGITGAGALTKAGTGTLMLVGDNTYQGGTTISGGAVQLGNGGASGSIAGDVTDNGTLAFDRSDAYTFAGAVSGSGVVNQIGSGITVLNADNTYTGGTSITAGTLVVGDDSHTSAGLSGGGDTLVATGATLGGYGNVSGTVTNNGTIAVADALSALGSSTKGNFTVNGTLVNNGVAQVGGTGVGNKLVTNSYVGGAGSVLALNTYLGGDGSPSDRLVINGGTATGTSSLRITNAGGPGALTTANGIEVVEAINGGTTAAGAFALASAVAAGPYEYSLYRGSTDGSSANNWYLRSQLDCSLVPGAAACAPTPSPAPTPTPTPSPSPAPTPAPAPAPAPTATPTPAPTPAPTPTPAPSPSGSSGTTTPSDVVTEPVQKTVPLYRQEVSLYTAIPSMALAYGQGLMDSLHERVGEDEIAQAGSAKNDGSWARVIAQHGSRDGGSLGIYGNKGPSYNDDMFALQGGFDLHRADHDDGSRDIAGVYVAIGQIAGDVKHFDGTNAGRDQLRGYTLGGYWTHFGPSGWYLDGVAQGTWYDIKASSTRMAPLKTDGRGFAGSIEGGYPVHLGNGWVLVPQAQLVYQQASFNDASDAASNVYFGNADSLAGRVGGEVKKSWALNDDTSHPKLMNTWLRVDLWREFMANPNVSFSTPTTPVSFQSDLKGSWIGLRAGFTSQLARNVFVYANVGYDVGVQNHSDGYSGKAGVRVNW